MHLANGEVVRVEQKMKLFIKVLVIRQVRLKHKVLKEPGDVREVPLGRADVRHRLHDRIFRLQISAQTQRCRANPFVPVGQ